MSRHREEITTGLLLRAYRAGLFPMAETRGGARLYWLDPEARGILPLHRFHLPRRLLRTVRSGRFTVTCDTDFAATIAACATIRADRHDTWINPEIEQLFRALHAEGHAHSVEAWHDGRLAGGLYGVTLGAAFFGESMFSFETDASKVALVHLVARLRLGGFRLLDTQFLTAHLARFGAIEVPRATYRTLLADALEHQAAWLPAPEPATLAAEIRGMRMA